MNDSPLQLALRETRAHFSDPRVLGGLAVVAVLLGLVGPFGTFEQLPVLQRVIYWVAMAASTYLTGFAAVTLLDRWIGARLKPEPLRIAVVGGLPGLPITLVVVAINAVAYGTTDVISAATLLVYCALISIGVTAISAIVAGAVHPKVAAVAVLPPILLRVPHPQRGKLIALTVADHYVEVITDKGKALVLMRLSDAIKETGEVAGLQIHRSHWVALDAVKRVARSESRLLVELTTGEKLPVSRGFLPAARAAGLVA